MISLLPCHDIIIGVQVIVFSQLIGSTRMSRFYPECMGHELSMSDCLRQHPASSTRCSAKRIGVLCFPTSADIQTEISLCGFEIPVNTTTHANNSNTENSTKSKSGGDQATTLGGYENDITLASTIFVAGNIKYSSGFSHQKFSDRAATVIATLLVVSFVNFEL